MTATCDIRLLVCDEQSACRDEVHESALVAEAVFWVYLKGFRVGSGRASTLKFWRRFEP
jgi:hypothetical protein